ncbi:helix-turn-helix transcriptional regulator [Pantoea vagans]|uniref:helix-turn-helix transcriptional regulator n=1 Tax=Pantoea vagans TaxID=470934 RepID=UPI0023B11D0E|nr:XRE family transcriptional regulator [Pantoea vagans]MDE8559293.1 XRE family transcriptional regulator [Pantoea vagans]MDE8579293.1 XRE family transcriptional regulator [Pantoea vagans]
MDGHTSPARFLACLLAEHDISITQLCRRSGMDSADAWAFLAGRLPVTPALAEQLGRVFHTPGFWLNRQALWARLESDPKADNDGPAQG